MCAEMIDSNNEFCPVCTSDLDLAWVIQWDGKVDESEEVEVEAAIEKLKNITTDGTNATGKAKALTLKPVSFYYRFEAETSAAAGNLKEEAI